jgi:hypothetical protein
VSCVVFANCIEQHIKPFLQMHQHEELPTGKVIVREFDAQGFVVNETHTYGALDIGIAIEFSAGMKTNEMYFVKRRLVSRKRYEKARAEYMDMPTPDLVLEDFCGQLVKAAQAERRQFARLAKEHKPDANLAAQTDAFCRSLLEKGKCAEISIWLASPEHTLGELSYAKSQNLIAKLLKAGAKHLYACDVDQYDDGGENTGHVVIELPDSAVARNAVLREVGRLAAKQGLRGDCENGQRYTYVKLD